MDKRNVYRDGRKTGAQITVIEHMNGKFIRIKIPDITPPLGKCSYRTFSMYESQFSYFI